MDRRDIALQRSMPTVAVPKFTAEWEKTEKAGERILVAANGIFLEVTRKWGYFVRRIGSVNSVIPYGKMEEVTQLLAPKLPRQLLQQFNYYAQQAADQEIGACILWNEHTNQYRLKRAISLAANTISLKYQYPDFEDGDHLIIDCHSHSIHPAFFSAVDDEDDKYAVKFSYVVGNCSLAIPTTAMRLCIKGKFDLIDTTAFFNKVEKNENYAYHPT
jgi:PRTRC genetic system protein A